MRPWCGVGVTGFVAAMTAVSGAEGQALSFAETMRALPGQWELDPAEMSEEERGEFRCDAAPLEIVITPDPAGGYAYQSQRMGEEDVARSAVMSVPARSGRPLFMVQYEDETRLDDAGRPLAWAIEMPDANHFYWLRVDMLYGHPVPRTVMRRRCPVATS